MQDRESSAVILKLQISPRCMKDDGRRRFLIRKKKGEKKKGQTDDEACLSWRKPCLSYVVAVKDGILLFGSGEIQRKQQPKKKKKIHSLTLQLQLD